LLSTAFFFCFRISLQDMTRTKMGR